MRELWRRFGIFRFGLGRELIHYYSSILSDRYYQEIEMITLLLMIFF